MHKFGWLLVGFGALLLLSRGGHGFIFFPLFFFWPLILGALFFGIFGRGMRHGRHGWHGRHGGARQYYWRGQHGTYGHSCGQRQAPSAELHDEERQPDAPRANTGETTRL